MGKDGSNYLTWRNIGVWAIGLLVMLMGAVVADTRANLDRKADREEVQEFKRDIRDFMKEMRALHTRP